MTEDRPSRNPAAKTRRPWYSRLWRSIARISFVCYGLLLVIMTSCQSKMVYHPSRELEMTPKAIGLDFEEVRFAAADGVNLFGWFVGAPHSRGVILFCHGNAGNISHRLFSIGAFHRMGYDVFIFDYRGYGLSEGEPSEEGTYLDADAAWGYLTAERGCDPTRIVIFGRSLGGSIAAHLASERQPAKLILESTFSSAADIAASHFWFLPTRLILRYKYDTASYVKAVTAPVLVIHSLDDDIVPYPLGRKVFAAANQPKTFVDIHGDHNNGHFASQQVYLPALRTFLNGQTVQVPPGQTAQTE